MTPCYPAYLINPCPKLPAVQFYSDPVKDAVFLRYKVSELLKINRSYWTKLEGLYHFGCRDDYQKYNLFLQRAWCLLKRYQVRDYLAVVFLILICPLHSLGSLHAIGRLLVARLIAFVRVHCPQQTFRRDRRVLLIAAQLFLPPVLFIVSRHRWLLWFGRVSGGIVSLFYFV